NILVTPDGWVKLLDFGIARLLDPGDEDGRTRTGAAVFTPEYASPEQLRAEPVTTASDIHQLGTLLYVLLTGRRPFEGQGRAGVLDPAGRSPPPPSAVAGDDARLRHALRGDLDTIVLE